MSTIIICPRSGNFCTQTGCNKDSFVCDSAHSFTESAYKEVESSEPQEKRTIEDVKNSVARNAGLKDWNEVYKRILPSQIEPLVDQAIRWSIELYKSKPVSAPSEFQEDKFEAFFYEFQERYAFQVPYNGTNEFYDKKKLEQAESFKMDMKFAWDKIFTRKPE